MVEWSWLPLCRELLSITRAGNQFSKLAGSPLRYAKHRATQEAESYTMPRGLCALFNWRFAPNPSYNTPKERFTSFGWRFVPNRHIQSQLPVRLKFVKWTKSRVIHNAEITLLYSNSYPNSILLLHSSISFSPLFILYSNINKVKCSQVVGTQSRQDLHWVGTTAKGLYPYSWF